MAHVLIIDDDQSILDLLALIFSTKGHRTTTANDGEDGLRLALDQTFDLVITDLNMPKVTGWDIIAKIKSSETVSSVPILALSAHSTANDKDAAYSAGCDAYVTKPFDPEKLLDVAESVLKA